MGFGFLIGQKGNIQGPFIHSQHCPLGTSDRAVSSAQSGRRCGNQHGTWLDTFCAFIQGLTAISLYSVNAASDMNQFSDVKPLSMAAAAPMPYHVD